jgi:hypothetical protein
MAFNVTFSNTIPFNDPKYRSIFLKVSGDLMVESDNPSLLVPGSEQTVKYVADMANYSIGRTLISMGSVSFRDLSTKLGEFVNVIASDLKSRSITLVGAAFNPIVPDDASQSRISRQDEMEKMTAAPAPATAPAFSQAFASAAPTAAPVSNEPVLMKYCARCGTPSSGTKFCTTCGSSMIKK